MNRFATTATLAIVVAAALTAPAQASITEGMWAVFLYGGLYEPGPDVLDDDTIFGIKAAKALTEHVAVGVSLARTSSKETVFVGPMVEPVVDWDATLLDISVYYSFLTKRRLSPSLGGGIGAAFSSADGNEIADPMDRYKLDDSSLTLHAGFGTTIEVTRRFYLRINSRWRWFENRDDDEIDNEKTLNFGWVFGRE